MLREVKEFSIPRKALSESELKQTGIYNMNGISLNLVTAHAGTLESHGVKNIADFFALAANVKSWLEVSYSDKKISLTEVLALAANIGLIQEAITDAGKAWDELRTMSKEGRDHLAELFGDIVNDEDFIEIVEGLLRVFRGASRKLGLNK